MNSADCIYKCVCVGGSRGYVCATIARLEQVRNPRGDL